MITHLLILILNNDNTESTLSGTSTMLSMIIVHLLIYLAAINFLTALCSSNKKALKILVLTHFPQTLPPYALETVLSLFLEFLNPLFVICLIPMRETLQSAHLGPLDFLAMILETSFPPGVLTGFERREEVA